jgi:ribosomal protein L37E
MDKKKCPKCGQTEYHSGEYPCSVCGRPILWDEEST